MYTVNLRQQEYFFLGRLLPDVKYPTLYVDIRPVDGTVCLTYRETSLKRGLLEDYAQWDASLTEEFVSQCTRSLKALFSILIKCEISDLLGLWDKDQENLAEYYKH